ncbi:hypothetical protein FORMA_18350 [Formosa sp. Hel3_A1_48]|nr:hypothetical protein FORMA_18350 [Formosa sp. Hel3_A1_48]
MFFGYFANFISGQFLSINYFDCVCYEIIKLVPQNYCLK